jgi:hypothetical protein
VKWDVSPNQKEYYFCVLDDKYRFEVRKFTYESKPRVALVMSDFETSEEVFVLGAYKPNNWSTEEEDQIYRVISDLHEQARRSALDIDKKLTDVKAILRKQKLS